MAVIIIDRNASNKQYSNRVGILKENESLKVFQLLMQDATFAQLNTENSLDSLEISGELTVADSYLQTQRGICSCKHNVKSESNYAVVATLSHLDVAMASSEVILGNGMSGGNKSVFLVKSHNPNTIELQFRLMDENGSNSIIRSLQTTYDYSKPAIIAVSFSDTEVVFKTSQQEDALVYKIEKGLTAYNPNDVSEYISFGGTSTPSHWSSYAYWSRALTLSEIDNITIEMRDAFKTIGVDV